MRLLVILANRDRRTFARLLRRSHWRKVGVFTGDVYCGAHGRAAGWPCALRDERR